MSLHCGTEWNEIRAHFWAALDDEWDEWTRRSYIEHEAGGRCVPFSTENLSEKTFLCFNDFDQRTEHRSWRQLPLYIHQRY